MEYRKLGRWGIELSELGLGSWITFGSSLDINGVHETIRQAFDAGVNMFDNAEAYADGTSEMLMGEALRHFPRHELVVSTKIFWGGKAVNSIGLSRKHLIEGCYQSLRRLQLDYVDILFCHRPDPNTPMEETVQAMDFLVRTGCVFYWGTSGWSLEQIEEAHRTAKALQATPPVVEQPQYNLFHRGRVEREYLPLYEKYGMGTTIWSPLDSGILTGKYNDSIPSGSRLERHAWLKDHLSAFKIEKVKKLENIAKELGCSPAQLAIAWCLKNAHVSSVLVGVTSPTQLHHNLKATAIKYQITPEVISEINHLFQDEA